MGPIQASLNSLTGSIWGGIASMTAASKAAKFFGGSKQPKAPKQKAYKSSTLEVGYLPRIGKRPYRQKGGYAAGVASLSGNDLILQKARGKQFSIASRLSILKGGKE